MQFNPESLDKATQALAIFRTITDDIELFYRRNGTISETSVFGSVCTTYVKLISNKLFKEKFDQTIAALDESWKGGISGAIVKFKIFQIEKWITQAAYTEEDAALLGPILHRIMQSDFEAVIHPEIKKIPKFSLLKLNLKIQILERFGEYCENKGYLFTHVDYHRALEEHKIVYFIGPSIHQVGSLGDKVVWRIKMIHGDRALYCAISRDVVFRREIVALNARALNIQTEFDFEAGLPLFLPEPDVQQTSLVEVFSAIGKSEFKKSLWSLFSVLKLSSVAAYLCDLVSPSGALKTAIGMLDEVFKISGAVQSIQDIFYRLFTEILPAIWYGDASLIKPELFSSRMDIIYKAIVAAKSHNREVMTEVIHEWGAHQNTHIVELEMQFHEVLVLMTKFVSSSTTTHLTSVMRSVISDLIVVEQQIANYIRLGQTRYEPFSIGLRGEAGIGKSTLITEIQANIGTILDLPCHTTQDNTVVYDAPAVITEGVKFDENIYNTTKTIVFDDMNLVAAEFQEKGSGNLSVKFLQCQGSVPFSLNKANIEEKKGSFWNNNLTVVTSNLPNYGLDARVMDQGAWSRRIHVDIEMQYLDIPQRPGEKDRNYVRYIMSFLNYDTSRRHEIITDEKERMFALLRTHAEVYWTRRARRRVTLGVCALCRELPHNCQCALQQQNPRQINERAALWMSEEYIVRASLVDVAKTMITEEAVSYFLLLSLMPLLEGNILVVMLIIGIIREMIEWYFKKPFDFFRFVLITVSLPYFPFSIISHIMINYSLLFNKLKNDQEFVAPAIAEIPIFIEDVTRQTVRIAGSAIRNEFTPTWWTRWRISRMNPLNYRKQIEKKHALYFCGFMGAGFVLKTLYDMSRVDYTQTAFGQPASETDKQATRTLDAQIGGNPEPRQDGLATTNDWKRPMKILYQPGGITPHGANTKCIFNVKITNGKMESLCKGFVCSEGFVTVRHAIPDTPSDIVFWHESTPNERVHMSYEPNSTNYKYFNDLVILPYSDSRKKMSIIRDHTPKLSDKYMVNGVECAIVGVATNLSEYPYLMILDIPGAKGLSGSMVTLIQREGAPVTNVIVGAIVAVFNKGPLAGKACAELFMTQNVLQQFREMPKTLRTNEIEAVAYYGDVDKTASSVSSLEQTNPWLSEEFDVLQPYLTPEIVRHAFLRIYDVKVSENVATHSVLGHLQRDENGNVRCNIGEFVGSVSKPPAPNKSKFYRTEFYSIASQLGDVEKYTIPKLEKFVENGVYHNSLLACVRQMNSSGYIYDQAPFWTASELVYEHIREVIGDDIHSWEPYDLKTVIIGDTLTNAINRDAAKGFPFKGVKDDWVWGDIEEPVLSKELVDDIQRMIDNMDNYNIPPLNIASTALKDEIITKKKSEEAMVRVFFGGNTAFLILCRAYLGKLMNIFVKHRKNLFAKIGMNAIGAELHEMVNEMFKKVMGIDLIFEMLKMPCWVDGDFSKYDKMLLVLKFAIHVLWMLGKDTRFFRQHAVQLNRLRLILTALQEYIVIIGEDIFIMRDKMPSGVWATALINCICEMIIEVLMFYFLLYITRGEKIACDFVARGKNVWNINVFEVLAIANYGDDNIKCVAQAFWPLYKHESIMIFSKWLHMAMTPARKHETEIRLKPITEILFLKRVFTWNPHLQRLVGALDIDSIAKMLAFSDTKNVDEWRYAVIMTARREIAFHGLALYDRFRGLFKITQTWKETLDEIDRNEWKFVPEVQVPIYEIIFDDLSLT